MLKIPSKPNLNTVRQRLSDIFKPIPDTTVTQWADLNRYLSAEYSKPPGRYMSEMAAYQIEPMDAVKDPDVQSIVFQWAGQTGKTVIIENIIGYFIDQEPSPILLVRPTKDDAEIYSRERLAPLIRDTPILAEKIRPAKGRDAANTVSVKTFPGGTLALVGANSPIGLSSRARRVVIGDEIDRFPDSAGAEGDPWLLAIKRTEGFYDAVIVGISTPTIKGRSRIEAEFLESDQRFYFVPCVHCDRFQRLEWDRFHYEPEAPEKAFYTCSHCDQVIDDRQRLRMIATGEWRATAEFRGNRGYHLNGLYSPLRAKKGFRNKYHQFAQEHLNAKALDRRKESDVGTKTWTNTFLAETYEVKGDELEADEIGQKGEEYPFRLDETGERVELLPEGVLWLSCGIDTQKSYLQAKVMGWGLGEESWLIEWRNLPGNPARDEVWAICDSFLSQEWERAGDGRKLTLASAFIDIQGHDTDSVFSYVYDCQKGRGRRPFRKIHAIQGSNSPGGPVIKARRAQRKRKNIELISIATDTAKDVIFRRLRIANPGPGYMHHPDWLDDEYYAQLTAEKAVPKIIRGREYRDYVKTRQRNEALDCTVYAFAAMRNHRPNMRRFLELLDAHRKREAEGVAKRPEPEERPPVAVRPVRRRRKSWATRF